MKSTALYHREALRLLEDGKPHKLRLWKMSTGDHLLYQDAVCISTYHRGGRHKVRLLASGEIREFRDFCLYEIDDLPIYL